MQKPVIESKYMLKGAFILTFAAILTKVLSAIYRVPFQNIVGDVGFYIYQQVYPFYGIALVFSTYGFPVVISKLYVEFSEKKDQQLLKKFILVSFTVLFLVGLLAFFVLYIGADWIALKMKDQNLAMLLRISSIAFLFMPFIALIRGIYQGKGDMVPTAVSQVGEQFIRVATILVVSAVLLNNGYSLYFASGGAVFGSITGALTSTCILIIFLISRKEYKRFPKGKQMIKTPGLIKALLIQGFAVCFSGMLLILIQLADSMNLYSLLVFSGIDEYSAKELKGIYDRGQPLIQLGTVAATSISLSLVPLISSAKINKTNEFLKEQIQLALKISIVIGAGATAGLWCIIAPVNTMLFENSDGSEILGTLSLMIVLMSVIMTLIAVLQGLGYMFFPAVIVMVGAVLKYFLNRIFVPDYGTLGAAIASLLALFLVFVIFTIKIIFILRVPLLSKRFFIITILAISSMVILLEGYLGVTNFLYSLVYSDRLASTVQALSAVIIGGGVYLFIIIKSGVFQANELKVLPFGRRLLRLLPKKLG
ncbi:polysaccharide biosynthesis protein [Bacillus aquiflavi]|nr:polysaccharide biosynthesis protein [Bacillus aquiflavi]MBA4538424.1 polysaccharide biosynthesis protein [Bacillus aquiflavi]UAC50139.1 polysaccharide biosynthesis protein [Bacillus aquiflavi]